MQHIPNPLLSFLLRREERTFLTWRFTIALTSLLAIGGIVLLIVVMLSIEDYYVRQDYESAFGIVYLGYIGLSVLTAALMSLFGAIITTTWASRDEKYDLLRLTPLPERAFVESYFLGVIHRLRLLLAIEVVLGVLTPFTFMIIVYWSDHPNSTYYSGYYYSDYQDHTSLSTYLGAYGLLLLVNIALTALSLIGTILGVRFGLYFRRPTSAITSGVGATCGSLLGLAVAAGCCTYGSGIALSTSISNIESEFVGFTLGYACVTMVCIVPVFAVFAFYFKETPRVVRRD